MNSRSLGILAFALAAVIIACFIPPIPQDPAYRLFADTRKVLLVPNFMNVISNVPFLIVSFLGLRATLKGDVGKVFERPRERWPFLLLFAGVLFVGIGSSYYHLTPSARRLVWDRLPMTVVFMSLFGIVLIERIGWHVGRWTFVPLIGVGIASVIYWAVRDDLRFYILVQFLPILLIPLLLWLCPPKYTRTSDLYWMIAWYLVAKVFELLDVRIFSLGWVISGHSLKHVASAIATYLIARMVQHRHLIWTPSEEAKRDAPCSPSRARE